MAELQTIYNLRYDETLRKRVAAAATQKAQAILLEPGSVENHAARVIWANQCLADPVAETEKIMWRVVQNTTIQNAQSPASIAAGACSPDGDIQFVVNGVVDALIVEPV